MAFDDIHNEAEAQRRAVYDTAFAQLIAASDGVGAQLLQLQSDLNARTAELAAKTDELTATEATLADTQTELSETQGELSESLAALDTATIDLASSTAALNAANIQVDDLEQQVATLTAALEASQAWGLEQQAEAISWANAYQDQVDLFNQHMLDVHSTPIPETPPPVPVGLTADAGDARVDLDWLNSDGATNYHVFQAPSLTGPWTQVADVTASNRAVTGLTNGTTYFFAVSSLADDVESDKCSAVSAKPLAPVTPPPTDDTVFGGSDGVYPINGVPASKGLPAHRAYLGGGDLTANTSWTSTGELSNALARVKDGGIVWLSIKDNKPNDLARIIQQFNTLTAARNLDLVVTYRHEPENDVDQPLSNSAKQADIASYQAAWAALKPVIHNNGAASATCLLGDRVSPNSPNNAESVAYHVVGVTYVGFDRYNPGLGNATSYTNATTVLQGVTNYTINRSNEDGRDYPLVIGEWGTIAVGSNSAGAGGDQAGRRTWAQAYVNRCKAIHADPNLPDIPVVLYWNQSRMAFNTDPTNELAQIALDLN